MKITKISPPSKRRLTIEDISFVGGEVIEVGGKVYLFPVEEDCEFTYAGYAGHTTHTIFVDLENGKLISLKDDCECRLIKDAEFKYDNDNTIEWVE